LKKTLFSFTIHKMNKPDLLGCVCLYDDECTRNCRIEGEEFDVPPNIKPIDIYCEQSMNDPASIACECVEDEENARPSYEIAALQGGPEVKEST
jgi:hypothetical protein